MSKKKREFIGWIGKPENAKDVFTWRAGYLHGMLHLDYEVCKRKETMHQWDKGHWPPKKIRITVEEI